MTAIRNGRIVHEIVPDVATILLRGTKTFLLKRANTNWHDNEFNVPSGHIEPGETPRQAAVREILEEAGVAVNIDDLKLVSTLYRKSDPDKIENDERVDFIFVAEKWQGEPKNNEPHKCSEVGWFELDQLPESLIGFNKRAFECLKNGQAYSEFGW